MKQVTATTIMDAMDIYFDLKKRPKAMKMTAVIKGTECPINDAQDRVLYKGQWLEILEDQEGDPYIMPEGSKAIYITINQ